MVVQLVRLVLVVTVHLFMAVGYIIQVLMDVVLAADLSLMDAEMSFLMSRVVFYARIV